MADRWMDDRDEREWREHQRRTQRYGRDADHGPDDYTQRDYALGDEDSGYRSFQPQDRVRDRGYGRDRIRSRGPVFGERETGASYSGARQPSSGYSGQVSDQDYGGRNYADQNFSTRSGQGRGDGGRFYGDDGRTRLYREDLTSASASAQQRPRDDYRHGPGHGYRAERHERDRDEHNGPSFWDRAQQRVASWFGEFDDDRGEGNVQRDSRQFGHRGRGPQGYKRADERINDEAHERLTDDPWVDATNLSITVSGGEVTLSGTVETREAKHRAERIVEDISGVNHVQNNIRIDRGSFLSNPGRGFGDSANEALMRDRAGTDAKPGESDLTLNPSAKGASRSQ